MKCLSLLLLLSIVIGTDSFWWAKRRSGGLRGLFWGKKPPVVDNQPKPTPCTPVDGEWSEWEEVKSCPTCNSTWLGIVYGGKYSNWRRFCSKPQCGGKRCVGSAYESRPCPDLPFEREAALGDWEEKKACTGKRVEKQTKSRWVQRRGWFWRVAGLILRTYTVYNHSYVTCHNASDTYSPRFGQKWIQRPCVDPDQCGGCPPHRFYERRQKCELPLCEDTATESPTEPITEEPTESPTEPITEERTESPTEPPTLTPTTELPTEPIAQETPTPEEPTELIIVEETPTPEEEEPTLDDIVIEDIENPGGGGEVIDEPLPDRTETRRSVGVPSLLEEDIEDELKSVGELKSKLDDLVSDLEKAESEAGDVDPDDEDDADEEVAEVIAQRLERLKEDIDVKLRSEEGDDEGN